MKPLVVLLGTFAISLFILKLIHGEYEFAFAGRIAMAVMLLFTSIAHFAFTKGMAMMIPDFIPYKIASIYLTGIFEIVAAVGLLMPALKVTTGWLLITFFIVMLPANIYASIKHINYEKATFDGNGLQYLWFRMPLQILFIVWTYICAIRF